MEKMLGMGEDAITAGGRMKAAKNGRLEGRQGMSGIQKLPQYEGSI